ncbi:MAG TPA: ABC transporter ATPase, partial [Flavobacterium sp.]|nr:ABC transporter ATPase [Flavobacterium sp.]
MYIPFKDLPPHSKVWIYQANRKLTDAEVDEISNATQLFIEQWAAHGTSLEASYLIKYNRFIILAVNQDIQKATGCSIDSSVQFIQ